MLKFFGQQLTPYKDEKIRTEDRRAVRRVDRRKGKKVPVTGND